MPNDAAREGGDPPAGPPPPTLTVPAQFPTPASVDYPLLALAREQPPVAPIDDALAHELTAVADTLLGDNIDLNKPRIHRLAATVLRRLAKDLAATDPPTRPAEYRKRAYRLAYALEVMQDDMLGETPDTEKLEHISVSMSELANELWTQLREAEEPKWDAKHAAEAEARKNKPPVGWMPLPEAFTATDSLASWDRYNPEWAKYDPDHGCKVPVDEGSYDTVNQWAEGWMADEDHPREFKVAAAVMLLKMRLLREGSTVWKATEDKEAFIARVITTVDEGYQIALAGIGKLEDGALPETKDAPAWLNDDNPPAVPSPEEAAIFIWNMLAQGDDAQRKRLEEQEKMDNLPGNRYLAEHGSEVQFAIPKNLEWGDGSVAERLKDGWWSSISCAIDEGFITAPCDDDLKTDLENALELMVQANLDEDEEDTPRQAVLSVVTLMGMHNVLKYDSAFWLQDPAEIEAAGPKMFIDIYNRARADLDAAGDGPLGEWAGSEQDGGEPIWKSLVQVLSMLSDSKDRDGGKASENDAEDSDAEEAGAGSADDSDAESADASDDTGDNDSDDDSDASGAETSDDDKPEPQGKLELPKTVASNEYAGFLIGPRAAKEGAFDVPLSEKMFMRIVSLAQMVLVDQSTSRQGRMECIALVMKARVFCKRNNLWDNLMDGANLIAATNQNVDAALAKALGRNKENGDEPMKADSTELLISTDVENKEWLVPDPDEAAQEIWDMVAAVENAAAAKAERESAKAARLPGALYKGPKVQFPLSRELAAAFNEIKAEIDPGSRENLTKGFEAGFLEAPFPDTLSLELYYIFLEAVKDTTPLVTVALWEQLSEANQFLDIKSEAWFEEWEDIAALPARLTAAFNIVVSDLQAWPEDQQLEYKEDLVDDLSEATLATKVWNGVYDRVRQVREYPSAMYNPYKGRRVVVTLPPEVVAHAKIAPLIPDVGEDGTLALPRSDQYHERVKPALEELIANVAGETRRTRAAAILAHHFFENFALVVNFTWDNGYDWAARYHRNYQRAYKKIVAWLDETPADARLKRRTTDYEGLRDTRRLWNTMWEELVESEKKARAESRAEAGEDDEESDEEVERVEGTPPSDAEGGDGCLVQ